MDLIDAFAQGALCAKVEVESAAAGRAIASNPIEVALEEGEIRGRDRSVGAGEGRFFSGIRKTTR